MNGSMTLHDTLKRIAMAFTVRDIMASEEKIVRAPDITTAQKLLKQNPDFDVIPIEQNGNMVSYIEQGSEKTKSIQANDIISDATSIIDLVGILKDKKFCFILVRNSISGYVHFSDLNNHIVKLPFFIILEALERNLIEKIGALTNEKTLELVLGPKRAGELRKTMGDLKMKRADLDWPNLLSFKDIVQFNCHFEKIKLNREQVYIISKTRNLVCHASQPLIDNYEDVKRLFEAKEICLSILNQM